MKFLQKSFVMAATLAVSGLTFTSAVAAAEVQERAASVTYTDLDLSTEEGVAELEDRIDRAARQVCELDDRQVGSRIRDRNARECYEEAKSNFEQRLSGVIREERSEG
ncbi:UrcA family protein [Aurantiacibacter marinus]|uniref:UrcA family protein n=1 Tax=Aurantiacibacter marinus TaxID=874156 RepID=UPI000699A381|nr:UrcA family protein [Aurantiacibacter marinus]